MAIAPPLGFTRGSLRSSLSSLRQPSTWLANASLISIRSISSSFRPARSSARGMAYAGPTPMMRGSTPALAAARIRASGLRPLLFSPASRTDDQRRGAVIHAGRVARGDHAALEERLQLGERFHRAVAPRMFVRLHLLAGRILLLRRQRDRHDFPGVEALFFGRGVFLLRGERRNTPRPKK